MGEDRRHVGVRRGDAIDAGKRADIAGEGVHAGLQIGADRGHDLDVEGEKAAVLVERQLGLGDVVARLRVAEESLRPRRDPFDRAPHGLRGEQCQRHLVVDRRFHAEAAADVAGDHADPALRHLQDRRQVGAVGMHALQRGVDGVVVFDGVVDADAGARLHGRRRHPVDDEAVPDHVGGAGDRRLRRGLVAEQLHEADIVGAAVPHPRRARRGRLRRGDDRRQRLVIDCDQLGGVERLVVGLGHHEGDIVADPAHPVLDQRRVGRPERAAVAPLQPAGDRQVAPAGGLPVGAGEHRQHPGRGLGLCGIDRANPRMGVRRAQHGAERHARQHHVTDIAAAALEQPRILEPGHALTNCEFTHCILGG